MFVSCQRYGYVDCTHSYSYTIHIHTKKQITAKPLALYQQHMNVIYQYWKGIGTRGISVISMHHPQISLEVQTKIREVECPNLRPGPGYSPKPKSSPRNWSATAANYAVHHEEYLEGIGTKMEPFINIQGKSRISHFPRRNWYKSTEAVFARNWLLLCVCLWTLITYMNLQTARNCISSVCIGNVCRPH